MKRTLISLALALSFAGIARADFNPVALTPGSFNADVVVESNAPPTINIFVTATMDGGTNNNGNTFYETGYATAWPWTGLPSPNSLITAVSDTSGNHKYRMPADYTANNAVMVGAYAGFTTGTLTVTTPAAYTHLSLLCSSANGPVSVNYVIHHSGGADEVGNVSIQDWTGGTTFAWYANGRVNLNDGTLNSLSYTNGTGLRLHYLDIPLTDTANNVTGIDFTYVSGGRAGIFGLSGSTDSTTLNPLAVTGFNRDMIIEAGAPKVGFVGGANVTMDGTSVANTGNGWYERGFNRGSPTTGLPAAGTSFTAGTRTFAMAPSYAANNVILLANSPGYTTATIPGGGYLPGITALSFLNSSGNGPTAFNVRVNYSGGGFDLFSLSSLDWFNAAAADFVAGGRYVKETLTFNNVGTTTGTKLFHNDVTLTGASDAITSIDLTWISGGRCMIFAMSGSLSGGPFLPGSLPGCNADAVVEATVPALPFPLLTATTASMDGGTNNTGNTWYERGYYTNTASPGLPPAGSTFDSQALPDHHYQMPASYTANNALYLDAVVTNVNITPVTPAAYSALSFLNSCANGFVTNQVIIQYQDGTAETNQFIGSDWFNTSVPFAYSSRGRTDLNRRTINNDPGRTGTAVPRLFEAQFFLNNFTSPITNILVQYRNATNSTGRIVVFGVSAATGAVGPIISANPISPPLFIETSNVVFSAGSVVGTTPITNRWQISTDGGTSWSDLTDGGQFAGATTPTLTITAAGVPNNNTTYRLRAVNVVGTNYSGTATITALSGFADITLPGDPLTSVGLNPDVGVQGVASSIDNTTQKHLIRGANAGAPFVGPVGFIVAPSKGASIIKAVRIYTANDATERDPADYTLEGSNDGGVTWTLISTNLLALPTGRNAAGVAITNTSPLTTFMQEVTFYANSTAYYSYRVSIYNLRNNATAVGCQYAEFDLLGVVAAAPPVIVRDPLASVTNYVGGSPIFGVSALGTGLSYQWSLSTDGGTIFNPVSGATNATYTKSNVQLVNSGNQFRCTVTNSAGADTSSVALLTVIAAPTTAYESAILADSPAAYWPLNETPDNGSGNAGTVVNDYTGAHNGIYTNVVLAVTGFNPVVEPDTAAKFGAGAGYTVDSYAGNMQDLTFAAPTNTATATFSVEAWVLNNPSAIQTTDAGLVTKGFGGGGEQFNLDCGSGAGRMFRFLARDAAGTARIAAGTIGSTNANGPFPNGGLPCWHHVVGVFDAPNGRVALYVDGLLNALTTVTLTNGVLSSASPVSIGSRQAAGGPYNNQFDGTIQDVAIYGSALSSNQVLNHYYAAQPLPVFSTQPTNTTAAENGPAVLFSSAYGPPAVTYQWYESTDSGSTFAVMPGKTSNNLAFASTPAINNNYQYFVAATDPYGSTTSSVVTLTVVQGPPFIVTDVPAATLVYAGRTAQLSVEVGGTAPFSYQWSSNGVNLSDGGRITGAQSNVLTIANTVASDSMFYRAAISNAQSGGVGGPLLSSPGFLYVESTPDFNTNGLGWSANGGATFANNTANMTDAVNSQARSIWYRFPLYIGNFYASFVYRDVTGGGADGFAFCLQNDTDGTAALGGSGGGLALSGISPSVALTFNIFGGSGMSVGLNGANGAPYTLTTPVGLDSTDPINVTVRYDGTTVRVTLTDSAASTSFTTNILAGSLPALLGADTAYVGFTAATGGQNAQQTVSDFFFIPLPALTVQQTAPGTAVLSWTASIGGYKLQSNTAVNSPGTWQDVTTPVSVVGGQNQVTVSSATGVKYYRLVMTTSGPL